MMKIGEHSKRAQLTIIIIVAIVIVLMIILYFLFRSSLFSSSVPRSMRPVYDSYLGCLETITEEGIILLGEQGGYINVPDFVPGSSYRPFSSQLDFLGQGVPYWMYTSGNNILKEQIPTKSEIRIELEDYVRERLDLCEFSEFEAQGYAVDIEEGEVDIVIKDNSVVLIAKNPVNLYFNEESARVNEHKVEVDIRLGKIYDQAKELYNYEKTDMFLEKYAQDVLRLYAPVDGVELQCTPIVFNDQEISENLTKGLVANMNFLKVRGSYYELSRKENEYFVVDPGFKVDTNVNFIYNPNWPTRIEIYGDRVAKPVGLQEGLSILGFCYVPYHLVYDVNFPVLIQLWEGDFFFQFPVSVIIEKNYARNALPPMSEGESFDSKVCQVKNKKVRVYTYDSELNPVPARIQFKCLNAQCEIGNTQFVSNSAFIEAQMPECLNGFIIASAEGYAETKHEISTNEEDIADIILPKLYKVKLDLGKLSTEGLTGKAIVTFRGEKYSATVLYPEMQEIELIEDFYNVSVMVYTESSLTVKGINDRKCVDVPVQGVGSILGLTEEKCNNINVPDMQVEAAIIGGGKTIDYITEDTLKHSREININVPIFYKPTTIEDLQQNYLLVEDSPVYISFE